MWIYKKFNSTRNKKICNGVCTAEIIENKPDNIIITYPKAFSDPYLRPQILLEIGAKAAWVPHDEYEIKPYIAEHYPQLFQNANAKIIATTPERSFWDNNSLPQIYTNLYNYTKN